MVPTNTKSELSTISPGPAGGLAGGGFAATGAADSSVAVAEGEGAGVGFGVAEGDAVGTGLATGAGAGAGSGVGVGEGEAVAVGSGVGVGVCSGVGVGVGSTGATGVPEIWLDATESPSLFTAFSRTVYSVPFVRPVITTGEEFFAGSIAR